MEGLRKSSKPWKTSGLSVFGIRGEYPELVCDCQRLGDAQDIIRAVNHHDELVAALEQAVLAIESWGKSSMGHAQTLSNAAIFGKKVLAKLEEE